MADRKPGELPVPGNLIARLRRHAFAHPWDGSAMLTCPRHLLDTDAILEPGRKTRVLVSFDQHYHGSGWFKNSDYEQNLHVSVSHPTEILEVHLDKIGQLGHGPGYRYTGPRIETPSDDEVWSWAVAFFGEHAPKAWVEGAASVFDEYRQPNVVHARLYYNAAMVPFVPEGEPYHLVRPWSEKVLGSAGGDVR